MLSNDFPRILPTKPNVCNLEGVFLSLPYGIPQGSCLGLLLFTIYTSELFEVLRGHFPDVHAYADDTQLYLSFKPNSDVDQHDAITAMEPCVKAIRNWMLVEKLKLNDDITEFLIIGT